MIPFPRIFHFVRTLLGVTHGFEGKAPLVPCGNRPQTERRHINSASYCFVLPHATSPAMQFFLINALDCLVISLFLYLLVALRDHIRRGGLSYPPGPPSRPIIGNLLDVPKYAPWIAYTDMSKKYGRRISLWTPVLAS